MAGQSQLTGMAGMVQLVMLNQPSWSRDCTVYKASFLLETSNFKILRMRGIEILFRYVTLHDIIYCDASWAKGLASHQSPIE